MGVACRYHTHTALELLAPGAAVSALLVLLVVQAAGADLAEAMLLARLNLLVNIHVSKWFTAT